MAKLSFAQAIKNLFSAHNKEDTEFFEDLADALIEGDIGAKNAMELVDQLEKECKEGKIHGNEEILKHMKVLLSEYVKSVEFVPEKGKINIWMMLGVNGVGSVQNTSAGCSRRRRAVR